MRGVLVDLTGKTFGRLTVVSRAKGDKNNNSRWNCKCSCGNEKVIKAVNLKNGNTKSCGCLALELRSKRILKDLTGKVFGRLTVVSRTNSIDTPPTWKCKCSCGNEKIILGYSLRRGDTKSCGCLELELKSKRSLKDLTGQTFGRLTVISRADNKGKSVAWSCKCICGNERIVAGGNLVNRSTVSCGCFIRELATKIGSSEKGMYRIAKASLSKDLEVENVPESLIKVQAMRFKISNFLKQS